MVSTQEDLEEAARQWEEQQRTQCDEKQTAQTDTNKGCTVGKKQRDNRLELTSIEKCIRLQQLSHA